MHPQPIHTRLQSQTLDRQIVRDFGITGYELMCRAGHGAFQAFVERWPERNAVAVLCGAGNNGGDGYVFASSALRAGVRARVFATSQQKSPEAVRAAEEYKACGGFIDPAKPGVFADQYDSIVDALFGTGLARNLEGEMPALIESVNGAGKPVLSLDMPSGLDADTGQIWNAAVRADLTTTFISIKLGMLTGRAKEFVGDIQLDCLDVPDAAYDGVGAVAVRVDEESLAATAPRRAADAHKGTAGRVLVIGGNRTMEGAALMAGQAAYRSGAGLVSVATVNGTAFPVSDTPEIRAFPVKDSVALKDLVAVANVIGIGPGLGQNDWSRRMWQAVANVEKPLVVDADALNLLAQEPVKNSQWILTPHPGEASRLLNWPTAEVQLDRPAAAREISDRYGGVCVLKGAGTLIAQGDDMWICDRGNPGMATGGMGDVLTGVICALRAQGLTAGESARTAVWLHATAADDCAANNGMVGMMATDLLPGIRLNLNRLINGTVR